MTSDEHAIAKEYLAEAVRFFREQEDRFATDYSAKLSLEPGTLARLMFEAHAVALAKIVTRHSRPTDRAFNSD